MAAQTPNRHYPVPDENAVPPQSGTEAFLILKAAVTSVDLDMAAVLEALGQKAATHHTHGIPDIEGLSGALEGKMPANRVFSLDDLTDVDGASDATIGYVLVKTPNGWLAQSALSAIGDHEHTMAQVSGLPAALNALQPISAKGTANGYAPLDENGKVPSGNLPSLTTTATVGAALAGASGKSLPADGDRFAGILAGASTVFHTTWGNIKAAIMSMITGVTNGNMEGRAYPRRVGGVALNFNWSGLGGQPTWLVGGENGTDLWVYNPANFNVNAVGGWTQATIANQIETRAAAYAANKVSGDTMFNAGFVARNINHPYFIHQDTGSVELLVSPRNLGSHLAAQGAYGVGTYLLGRYVGAGAGDYGPGTVVNGTEIEATSADGRIAYGKPNAGAWVAMGGFFRQTASTGPQGTTLFKRGS